MEKRSFPEEIVSTNIVLRKHKLELAKTMYHYVHKDRTRLARYLPWAPFIVEVADEEKYILSTHEKWEKGTFFDYGIFHKEKNEYMGNTGVHTINWENEHCELGYWILGDFEGKGFMSEAVRALEKTCFELGFHRIEIRCDSTNERSASVPRRLGYTHEGTLREDQKLSDGTFRSTFLFSKIKTDA